MSNNNNNNIECDMSESSVKEIAAWEEFAREYFEKRKEDRRKRGKEDEV
jgi:hypothetical protein